MLALSSHNRNFVLILHHPRGEILGSRMRFLLYPVIRNRQFQAKGMEYKNTLILFRIYEVRVQPTLCIVNVYTTAWGICFSVHFLRGVWRYLESQ